MIKKLFLLAIFFFIQLPFSLTYAHVLHYQKLNKLEFNLYRNNKLIGQHVYLFNRNAQTLFVYNKINFQIKKLGITLYKYSSDGQEKYINGKFDSFLATTKQNKKEKFAKIFKKENKFFIEGSSYKGKAPDNFIIGTWWNHEIVKSKSQISAASGRIIEQNVKYLGKESIEINNKVYTTLKFNFTSSDKSLSKGKKLNTNVWYDEKTLIWLKASFENKGKWEYRLKYIE